MIDGRFYLVATFGSEGKRPRGSQVLVADRPEGPFQPVHEPITPKNWECLDATLWTEPDGRRWTVFCHEWLQVHDGGMWAQPLDAQLCPVERPIFLFNASEGPWVVPMSAELTTTFQARPFPCYVTDGPFLHRLANGTLLMLWSSFGAKGHAMGQARSLSGKITGPWEHMAEPLVDDDGGHGMIFRAFGGQLYMTCHRPNDTPLERAVFIPLKEAEGCLLIDASGEIIR